MQSSGVGNCINMLSLILEFAACRLCATVVLQLAFTALQPRGEAAYPS
jgi:hypothetical protein